MGAPALRAGAPSQRRPAPKGRWPPLEKKVYPGFSLAEGLLPEQRELVSRAGVMRPVGVLVSGAEAFF